MAFYQLTWQQRIPAGIEQVWEFISQPANLQEITPPYMGFETTVLPSSKGMYEGMIVAYKVRPLLRIPLTWVTEITHVRAGEYFVDEQRIGPYAMWHHEHKIEPCEGGVLMTDIISYSPPLGWLGALANALFIHRQLAEIFEYRRQAIEKRFGVWPQS